MTCRLVGCRTAAKRQSDVLTAPPLLSQLNPNQVDSFATGAARAVSAGIEFALSKGLAVDGIKVLVVTGGADRASADESPVMTVENLGESGRKTERGGGGRVAGWLVGERQQPKPVINTQLLNQIPDAGMRAMSFLQRAEDRHTPYSSPFCGNTTYCNQDVHIGIDVRCRQLLVACLPCREKALVLLCCLSQRPPPHPEPPPPPPTPEHHEPRQAAPPRHQDRRHRGPRDARRRGHVAADRRRGQRGALQREAQHQGGWRPGLVMVGENRSEPVAALLGTQSHPLWSHHLTSPAPHC
jgi:hypothetical protein